MVMDSMSIDARPAPSKTKRVTEEERARVGRKLRARRIERAWDQRTIAEKADLSIGTVQAIESHKYRVNVENIEKYAAAVDTSIQGLLNGDAPPVAAPDPLLADLNREHLTIARRYMRALNAQRRAVDEVLLGPEPVAADVADVVLLLAQRATATPLLAYWTRLVLERGDLLTLLARRLDTDPAFEQLLRDQLASLAAYPVPPVGPPPRRGRARSDT
jgi:transcriptional regulator with XRE-family HTH domain